MSDEEPFSDQRGSRSAPVEHEVVGERTIAEVHRARSIEARVSSVMAVALMCGLGFALLAWYYGSAMRRPDRAAEHARALTASRAQSEMPLPSIGRIDLPVAPAAAPTRRLDNGGPPASAAILALPEVTEVARTVDPIRRAGQSTSPAFGTDTAQTPAQRALQRRLSGPVFARQSESPSAGVGSASNEASLSAGATERAMLVDSGASAPTQPPSGSSSGELGSLLKAATIPATAASVLPTQQLLLAKGAFIDCTLETAIDSSLPGMTTCITATDTFSSDGRVVLLERGSKLVGETRGEVQQGGSRVFVLWTEARTPAGVIVPLASPGTDELGRAGLSGEVNRHFWDRFGAAILISIIDAGTQAAVHSSSGGTVVYGPSPSQDVMTEVLKETIRIAPTIVKNQGDRIQVLVARDLDFRPVYELRSRATRR